MKRFVALACLLAVGATSALAQESRVRVRGIIVPPDVPVVTYETADAKALAPGGHVYIVAQRPADGSLSAARVAVGKNGLVPPM